MLKITDLSYCYRGRDNNTLNNLSLSLEEGEMLLENPVAENQHCLKLLAECLKLMISRLVLMVQFVLREKI